MRQKHSIYRILLAFTGALMTASAMAQETEPAKPTTLSETYDTWTVQCANSQPQEGQPAQRQCQMSQELLQQESRQRMLLFAVTKGEGDAKATLIMPFGLRLSEGIRIDIAEKELARGAFNTCLPAGCLVEIDLPEATIAQLQAADKVSISMTVHTGQPMKTDVSLKGFAAAYRRLLALAAD